MRSGYLPHAWQLPMLGDPQRAANLYPMQATDLWRTVTGSWRFLVLAIPKSPPVRAPVRWERGKLTPETAARLRAAREDAGLSLRRVHSLTGVSAGFLSEMERGLKRPRMRTTDAILRVIPVDPELEQALRRESVVKSGFLPWNQRPPGWVPQARTGADCGY